eukprot:1735350-Ditylum_brightwellii.AAC.1
MARLLTYTLVCGAAVFSPGIMWGISICTLGSGVVITLLILAGISINNMLWKGVAGWRFWRALLNFFT